MTSAASILDSADEAVAREALRRCCGASRWVDRMLARRPFGGDDALIRAADEVWSTMSEADVREAFAHHPRIGADLATLRARFAATASWSANEQSAVAAADEATLIALRDGNAEYEARFGYLFIVCASGKTAAEMLAILRERLGNDPQRELQVAAGEQAKITRLRLAKLAEER